MQIFKTEDMFEYLNVKIHLESLIRTLDNRLETVKSNQNINIVANHWATLTEKLIAVFPLQVSKGMFLLMQSKVLNNINYTIEDFYSDYTQFNNMVAKELKMGSRVFIMSNMDIKYYDNQYYSEDVVQALNDMNVSGQIRNDIWEAGQCMAFGLHQAAVFYWMRLTESMLNLLKNKINEDLMNKYQKKLKTLINTNSTWATMENLLNEAAKIYEELKMEEVEDKLRRIGMTFKDLRKVYRNDVMHPTETRYEEEDCLKIQGHLMNLIEEVREIYSLL